MIHESEADFQTWVIDYAKLRGWMIYHTWNATHSQKGFPDFCMTRKKVVKDKQQNRLIFAELKSDSGKLTLEQEIWLSELKGTNAEVYVWRPCDRTFVEGILA
jgi:hypothetical protein